MHGRLRFSFVRSSLARRRAVILLLAGVVLIAVTASRVLAQGYDDHNPVGVTGIFNGNVTTACSYDPLTHIAMTESVSLRWHRRIARLLAATLERPRGAVHIVQFL